MTLDTITIKGIRQGLLIALGDRGWSEELHDLESRLSASPSFFRGGRVALDVGSLELSYSEIETVHSPSSRVMGIGGLQCRYGGRCPGDWAGDRSWSFCSA